MKRRTVLKFAAAVVLARRLIITGANCPAARSVHRAPCPRGGADIACRIIAQKCRSPASPCSWKIAPGERDYRQRSLAHAAADGYTVGFISNALTVNAILQPKLPFGRSDIVPVTRLLNIPLIMVVPPSMPVNSVKNWWRSPSPNLANSATHLGTAGPHASDGMVQTRERHNIVQSPTKASDQTAALAAGEFR